MNIGNVIFYADLSHKSSDIPDSGSKFNWSSYRPQLNCIMLELPLPFAVVCNAVACEIELF